MAKPTVKSPMRSVMALAVILFHFVVVFGCIFLNATPGANVISTLLWIALAVAASISFRVSPAQISGVHQMNANQT